MFIGIGVHGAQLDIRPGGDPGIDKTCEIVPFVAILIGYPYARRNEWLHIPEKLP